MTGVELIAQERARQLEYIGYDADHDEWHDAGQFAVAAAVYVRCALTNINPNSPLAAAPMAEPPTDWPWSSEAFKPRWSDPTRNLAKAGALIAAEIDRLAAASSLLGEPGEETPDA